MVFWDAAPPGESEQSKRGLQDAKILPPPSPSDIVLRFARRKPHCVWPRRRQENFKGVYVDANAVALHRGTDWRDCDQRRRQFCRRRYHRLAGNQSRHHADVSSAPAPEIAALFAQSTLDARDCETPGERPR
jgi:hypothetical protein